MATFFLSYHFSVTKKLNNIYRIHMLVEYIVSYVNWAVLLLSMFAGNGGPLSFFNDMLLTTAGGSQFVFIQYFGGRIAEMVWVGFYCFKSWNKQNHDLIFRAWKYSMEHTVRIGPGSPSNNKKSCTSWLWEPVNPADCACLKTSSQLHWRIWWM